MQIPKARTARGPRPVRAPAIVFEQPWLHEARSPGGRPLSLTDLGNSERLVIGHGDDVRHIQTVRRWLVWDGTRWKTDENGELRRRARSAVRAILLEAAAMDDQKLRSELIAHQIRSESEHSIKAMMSLAEIDEKIAKRLGDFDADCLLLNVKNGTVDLRTGELQPHSRDDLITKLAPVEFDRDATAPMWEKFLYEIMDGDMERVQFLQRALGYSLTGDTSEHCFFLLFGIGANGKSTMLETCRFLLGDYAAQADFSTFLASKGGAIRNDLARLAGARFVSAAESDAGKRLAESVIKALTGGDTIAARYLYSEYFEFRPQFKLYLATNHKPKIVGTTEAMWRRVKLIPFNVTIPPEKRDHHLIEKLKAEASGILNWCLAGLRDWQADGLAEPAAVLDATSDYRGHEDVLAHFLDARCNIGDTLQCRAGELYETYKKWTEETGEFQMTDRDFKPAIEARGFKWRKTMKGAVWSGLEIIGSLFT